MHVSLVHVGERVGHKVILYFKLNKKSGSSYIRWNTTPCPTVLEITFYIIKNSVCGLCKAKLFSNCTYTEGFIKGCQQVLHSFITHNLRH